MKKTFLAALLFAVLAALPAAALDFGDPAPEISPDTWVTGEPADPTKADGKTIYLVEVWSVTCPPCVRTIPLLGELQKKYADQGLKIVSFTSDTLDEVKEFLKDHPMEYSSFVDKEGATTVKYMAADNRNTIPHAFLFDRSGAMVWTGNPLDNLEGRIKQVIDGTLTKERALAIKEARNNLQAAFTSQDVDGMMKSLKELETIEPDNSQYYQVHYRILTELGLGDAEDIKDLFATWYKGCQDQPEGLMILSVLSLDQGPPAFRNPELALAAAKRAYAVATGDKTEAGLNLAETYKSIGRVDKSLELLKELSANDKDEEHAEAIKGIQEFYNRLAELGKNPDAEYKP